MFIQRKMSKVEKLNSISSFGERLLADCQKYGITLKPEIGQHLLVDGRVVETMVGFIPEGARVIEIGAGPGQVTEALLRRGCWVVAIEIDRQFTPFLDSLTKRYPEKLKVIYDNALNQNWQRLTERNRGEEVWLIGSLPYHIIEPLMTIVANLSIEGAVFLIGKKFAFQIGTSSKDAENLGKLGLLVNTFFYWQKISEVGKSLFRPEPRTDSVIIALTPREESDYLERKTLFILRELFLGAPRSSLVKNALREALIKYEEFRMRQGKGKIEGNRHARREIRQQLRQLIGKVGSNVGSNKEAIIKGGSRPMMTKNEAREIITDLNLPETVLNKPLEQLNNQELGELFHRLREKFGFPFGR